MTPFNYYYAEGVVGNVSMAYAKVYQFDWLNVNHGLRPVINIRGDVLISSGDGTVDSPYQLTLS